MSQPSIAEGGSDRPQSPLRSLVPTGIVPVDQRIGGLEKGGSYVLVGSPGPAKMVAVLQFLHAGFQRGERGVLVTGADARTMLDAARAWGLGMDDAWRNGRLRIRGFRDDFELRAGRTVEPEEVLAELDREVGQAVTRVAIYPGTLFLAGGNRTDLRSAFFRWAAAHPATVLVTYSVDTDARNLPASAEWLLHAATGRIVVETRSGGLHQVTVEPSIPEKGDRPLPVSLQLEPGRGLVRPDSFPARRGGDRGTLDTSRILVVTLDRENGELRAWADTSFHADVVENPLDGVELAQREARYGGVVVFAPRKQIHEAMKAFRAIRPLTKAAMVFASDDAIRASDRIHLLEAGADDCLSGGVDFRELALRLRQAMASGSRSVLRAVNGGRSHGPSGGLVRLRDFRIEVERRLEDSGLGVFCILHVAAPEGDGTELAGRLAREVRAEDGDMVTRSGERVVILLQGARAHQAEPFLARVRSDLKVNGRKRLPVQVLSHPADAARIRSFLEDLGADLR